VPFPPQIGLRENSKTINRKPIGERTKNGTQGIDQTKTRKLRNANYETENILTRSQRS